MAVTMAQRVGRHISRLRHAQGLSQQQMADRAELRRASISEIENGVFEGLALDTLTRICGVLSLSLKEFFESLPGN